MMRSHITSESFRRFLEHRASASLGAVAEISPLRWDGNTLFSDSLKLHGTENTSLRLIETRHVRGRWDWMAVFSGTWRLEDISIESLKASFHRDAEIIGPTVKKPDSGVKLSTAILPDRFEVGIVKVRRAEVEFGDVSLKDTSLEILIREDSCVVTGTGGSLSIPDLPACVIDSFRIRHAANSLTIASCTMRPDGGGSLQVSGAWPGKLLLTGDNISLPHLTGSPWDRIVSGKVSGNATLDSTGASGRISVSEARLLHIEWLRQLSAMLGQPSLKNPAFTRAEGSFRFQKNAWSWTGIVLESAGVLRVEGDASISAERKLDGVLQLGVASNMVEALPGARTSIFTTERDGYLWTPVVLGGTLDAPSEDLSPRIIAAASAALIESVQPSLQAVPERTRDAVGETLDTLFDLIGP